MGGGGVRWGEVGWGSDLHVHEGGSSGPGRVWIAMVSESVLSSLSLSLKGRMYCSEGLERLVPIDLHRLA